MFPFWEVAVAPVRSTRSTSHARSPAPPWLSDTNWNTPCPARPMASPSASSSSGRAAVPGTRPYWLLCRIVRLVVMPHAPARSASSASFDISLISSASGSAP